MKSKLLLCGALLTMGCISKGTEIPPLTAGTGIRVDPATQTVSVDTAKVPTLPACAANQVVTMSADGVFVCANAAADSTKLGGLTPDNYASAAAGVAKNSAQLNGLTADKYAAATNGIASNSAQLNGLTSDNYVKQDPATGKANVTGGANVSGDIGLAGAAVLTNTC